MSVLVGNIVEFEDLDCNGSGLVCAEFKGDPQLLQAIASSGTVAPHFEHTGILVNFLF